MLEYCGEVCTLADFEQRKMEYSKEKRRHYYFMSLKADQVYRKGWRGGGSMLGGTKV